MKQIRDAWSSADSIVRTAIVICVAIVIIVGILYGVDMTVDWVMKDLADQLKAVCGPVILLITECC